MRKTTATALALLMLSPTLALAMGCRGADHIKQDTAQISCAEGMILDTQAHKCVDPVG